MNGDERSRDIECRDAEALLLEADGEELRGEGDGPLAAHLQRCEACRGIADRILTGERALDDALRERASGTSVDEMLRRVRGPLADAPEVRADTGPPGGPVSASPAPSRSPGSSGSPEAEDASGAEPRRRSVGSTVRWKVAVPLAAAALAAVALWSSRSVDEAPVSPVVKPFRAASTAETARPAEVPPGGTDPTTGARGGDGERVEVEADRRFALMKTENAAISVVWFY